MQRNPLPNHKGKGVAAVIIYANLGGDEKERSALPAVAITTLQKSYRFRNLFDQLELKANEQRIATKALVSIASGASLECLAAETKTNRAFLQDTNKITFSDEDMEIEYTDQMRPIYLVTSIN